MSTVRGWYHETHQCRLSDSAAPIVGAYRYLQLALVNQRPHHLIDETPAHHAAMAAPGKIFIEFITTARRR